MVSLSVHSFLEEGLEFGLLLDQRIRLRAGRMSHLSQLELGHLGRGRRRRRRGRRGRGVGRVFLEIRGFSCADRGDDARHRVVSFAVADLGADVGSGLCLLFLGPLGQEFECENGRTISEWRDEEMKR